MKKVILTICFFILICGSAFAKEDYCDGKFHQEKSGGFVACWKKDTKISIELSAGKWAFVGMLVGGGAFYISNENNGRIDVVKPTKKEDWSTTKKFTVSEPGKYWLTVEAKKQKVPWVAFFKQTK